MTLSRCRCLCAVGQPVLHIFGQRPRPPQLRDCQYTGGLYFLCIWVDFMWGHLVSDEIQRNLFVPDEMWLRRSGLSRTICQTTNSWKHLNFSKWEDTSICAATLHHQQNTPPWSHRSPWSAIILVHNRVRPGRVYLYVCKKYLCWSSLSANEWRLPASPWWVRVPPVPSFWRNIIGNFSFPFAIIWNIVWDLKWDIWRQGCVGFETRPSSRGFVPTISHHLPPSHHNWSKQTREKYSIKLKWKCE